MFSTVQRHPVYYLMDASWWTVHTHNELSYNLSFYGTCNAFYKRYQLEEYITLFYLKDRFLCFFCLSVVQMHLLRRHDFKPHESLERETYWSRCESLECKTSRSICLHSDFLFFNKFVCLRNTSQTWKWVEDSRTPSHLFHVNLSFLSLN